MARKPASTTAAGGDRRKLIAFDEETWTALDLLARDRMSTLQELADEAFADLLRKHNRPVDLTAALRQSAVAAQCAGISRARHIILAFALSAFLTGLSGALYGSLAKTFASDNAMKVTTDAVQVLGGYGYMKDHGVERMMRDAKLTQIYTGTNQITRIVAARQLLLER